MKRSHCIPILPAVVVFLSLFSCTREQPTAFQQEGPREIRPLCKLAESLDINEIDRAEAIVTGKGIDGEKRFALAKYKSENKLKGKLVLPEGMSSCVVTICLYDKHDRKIGQGVETLTPEDFQTGACETPVVGIESAKPRIDTIYAASAAVGINDSIHLQATVVDSFGGSIVKFAWKCGAGEWAVTGGEDTSIVAPPAAQPAYVCSLRAMDDDSNVVRGAVAVKIETRAPTVDAGSDVAAGIKDTISLSGTATDETEIVRYEWKFGDSEWTTTAGGDTNIIVPVTAQNYACSLRVTDDDGNEASDAVRVTVEVRPPIAEAGTDTSVGINDNVDLRGSGSSDETEIVEFAWKCGGGQWVVDGDGDTTVTAPQAAQAWVCSLRVTDDDGNEAYDAVTVTVEARGAVVDAGSDTTVGVNDNVNLRGSGSSDESGIAEYAWKCGEGSWVVDNDGDTTVTAPSTAQAWVCSLRVTDDEDNVTYGGVTVTVETRAPVADAGSDTAVGINDEINLRGSGSSDETSIVEYAWKCGGGSWVVDADGDTTVVAPSTAQSWVCSLRVTDDDGNAAYNAVTVTVETRAPVADAGSNTAVGINDELNLRGSGSSDETSVTEYAWKCGDGSWLVDADGDTTVVAPATAQSWVCSLRVTDNEDNVSYDAVTVTVETRAPVAGIRLFVNDSTVNVPGPNLFTTNGESVRFYSSRSGDETAIEEFAWKFGTDPWQVTAGTMELTSGGDTLTPSGWPDTTVTAPATAQVWSCSLRVKDDDGNYAFDGVDIAIREWTTYTTADGLADNVIAAIAVDLNGVKWFGTGNGVSSFDGTNWTMYTEADGLVGNTVKDIAVQPDGTTWFATSSGVCSFDGASWSSYTTSNSGLVSDDVRALAVDSTGVKWFATNSGVSSFDDMHGSATWSTYTAADGLGNNNCRDISVKAPRQIWVATTEGASSLLAGTWTNHTEADGLSENTVNHVAVDSEGKVWIGSGFGTIDCYEGNTWTPHTGAKGLQMSSLNCIAAGADGTVWFAVGNYVSVFNGTDWASYTAELEIGALLVESADTIWMAPTWSNAAGVYRLVIPD